MKTMGPQAYEYYTVGYMYSLGAWGSLVPVGSGDKTIGGVALTRHSAAHL